MTLAAADPAVRLAEAWQRDFPLSPRPFDEMAEASGRGSEQVIALLADLYARGVLARVGAIIRPNTIGSSTLAAMRVPPERLEDIAEIVSACPAVNHNYEREHAFNLWFVVTGADRQVVVERIEDLSRMTGCEAIDLPILRPYHIDLGFALNGRRRGTDRAEPRHSGPVEIEPEDRELLAHLEGGLALVARPYLRLAARLGWREEEVLARIEALIEKGVIARLGCIIRHRPIGFRANAMAVWDVPDDFVEEHAVRLAALDAVTLCYRRARRLPQWPYNLFAMVHGRERERVRREVRDSAAAAGLEGFPAATLFSRRCFKQGGAHYFQR